VLAALRGLGLGLVREAFSVGSIAIAYAAVVLYTERAAAWLERESGGEIGSLVAPWIAGLGIAALGVAGGALVGRLAKRGARLAGLGWIDRAGGVALGTAEGLLVIGILFQLAGAFLGREHPLLASSRGRVAIEELQRIAASGEWTLPDVAARPDP
jgi:uncharacterized membrane protein required for colicin V production